MNIFWATGHVLVTLTLAGRIRGGQAQATHVFQRAIQDLLLAWEQETSTARQAPLPNR
ncbi:MAG: hypothetical protein JOZ18_13620 [Chloroflexi bacterium]|nr:hypothetical protein [Chloroflexota bacterium]